MMMTFGVSS